VHDERCGMGSHGTPTRTPLAQEAATVLTASGRPSADVVRERAATLRPDGFRRAAPHFAGG
jgi:hypothetical protein